MDGHRLVLFTGMQGSLEGRMSYERAVYERLICDGCGVAVLETEDVLPHAPALMRSNCGDRW